MRKTAVVAGMLTIGLIATGCGGKRTEAPAAQGGGASTGSSVPCETGDGRITIATGNTGGVYYTLGGGLAQLISSNTKLKATAAETTASVQNIQQLVKGDYDVAFSLADTAADAVNGKESFTSPQKVLALARIYSNSTHVVVRTDAGIKTMADMKGKKISTGSPKSGTEVIANRLLTAAGLDPAKDVQAQRLALRQTVDGMKAGQIDGLVWSGGLPTPEITDLTTSMKGGVTFLAIDGLLDTMKKVNAVYDKGTIPAATYGLPSDVPTIVVPNVLLVRDDFPAGNACAITKLIFDKKDDLVKVHPAAKELSRDTATRTDPVPLHPGAKQALAAG